MIIIFCDSILPESSAVRGGPERIPKACAREIFPSINPLLSFPSGSGVRI
jgi:hypothetical protein